MSRPCANVLNGCQRSVQDARAKFIREAGPGNPESRACAADCREHLALRFCRMKIELVPYAQVEGEVGAQLEVILEETADLVLMPFTVPRFTRQELRIRAARRVIRHVGVDYGTAQV